MMSSNDRNDVTIIVITLAIDAESALSIAPVNGFTSPIKTITVNIKAIITVLFTFFLMPLTLSKISTPIITGINAVNEGELETVYPHTPNKISVVALMVLIK